MFGSFFRELWNATLAFTVFLAIVWGIGNIPDVLHLIQMLIVKVRFVTRWLFVKVSQSHDIRNMENGALVNIGDFQWHCRRKV